MDADLRPPHFLVPMFLLMEDVPGATASIIATYSAVCSFIYRRSKCNDGYSRWAPGISEIGRRARQHPSTVKRNLTWLERSGLLYRKRRFNQASVITLVNNPAGFRATQAARGRPAAKEEAEMHLAGVTEEARIQRAEGTRKKGKKVARWSHENERAQKGCSDVEVAGPGGERRVMSRTWSPNEPTQVAPWSHENNPLREDLGKERTSVATTPATVSPQHSPQDGNPGTMAPGEFRQGVEEATRRLQEKPPVLTPVFSLDPEREEQRRNLTEAVAELAKLGAKALAMERKRR